MNRSVVFFLFFTIPCFSQQEVADFYNYKDSIIKIERQIDATDDLKIKAEKLIRLSFYYLDGEIAMKKIDLASEYAKQIKDTLLILEAGLTKAGHYQYMDEYEKSSVLYDSIMPTYEKFADEVTFYKAVYQYAKLLFSTGRYFDALDSSLKAYDYFSNKEGEETYSGLLSAVIARVYRKLGRTQEAIRQYEKSLEWCTRVNHENCIGSAYNNLATLYLELDEIEKAVSTNSKADNFIKQLPVLHWHYSHINLTWGKIYLAKNQPDKAIEVLEGYIEKIKINNVPRDLASYNYQLARAYLSKKDLFNAMEYNSEALAIANKIEDKSLLQSIHKTNSLLFEKLGRPKKALESLRNHNAIRESILSTEKISQINELDSRYKAALTENKLTKLEKENAVKALQLQKSNQKKILWIGSIIALLFGLLGLIYFLRRQSRMNAILEEKNLIIGKSLQDKDILLREIHHRVKNNLQVVSSLLNLQSNYISDNIALEAITEGKNRVSSMALIHQNLYRENNLTSINCKEYFSDLIENLFDSYNIDEDNIQLFKNIENLDIDVDTMIPLGLIVNELVTNSLKHAFGNNSEQGRIEVVLKEERNELILSIADNGIGMSKDQFLNSDSFGNKMIMAFKQKLGAVINIKNDNGTKVSMRIKNYKLAAA
ncbi:MAG: histidine kinase dimerization/phosphoacceptor domain -containing protein [Bacteroidota bacterium]